MADLTISSLSREFIRVRVTAKEAGAVIDPTAKTVEMAIIAGSGEPVATDWKAASWETDTTTDPDTYYARIEVGPGSTVGALADGLYGVWVRITDTPEVPVRRAGTLLVT